MSSSNRLNPLITFRAETLAEALAVCRGKPVRDVRRSRIAHLRGVMAAQQGKVGLAIAYLTHALSLDPSQAVVYSDLADALFRRGREDEAIGGYLRAVSIAPGDAEGYVRLGHALRRKGRLVEAAAMYREALRLRPDDASLHGDLGDALRGRGQLHRALAQYLEALRLDPYSADCHRRLGQARLGLREWGKARAAFREGLKLDASSDLHLGIGEAAFRLGRLNEAERAFHAAVTIDSHDVPANRQYVLALELLGRRGDAVGAWVNLGLALAGQGRPQEAAVAYCQALARKADCLPALMGLARAHKALDEPHKAIHVLEQAVAVDPDRRLAHVEIGLALLTVGETERGWQELTWYHHQSTPDWIRVEQPVWDGTPLDGRPILLWTDAAISEALQFLRYVRFAKAKGGYVIVECNQRLIPLVREMPEVDHVIAIGGPRPPFDVHAPVRYFPALVETARQAPSDGAPYLVVPDELKERWRERLDAGAYGKWQSPGRERLVGISWVGAPGDIWTDLSLSALAPLAHMSGVRLIGLQRGPHRDELLAPPPGLHVEQVLDDSCSIADIAAVILGLDLVITADRVVAHLAGALGRPVWILLPRGAGWPWPADGDRMPWYATMRVFRQSRPGDWSGVLNVVRAALDTSHGRSETASAVVATSSVRERNRSRSPMTCDGYEAEILAAAMAICRDGLAKDIRQPSLLHLSALLAARDGHYDVASAYLQRTVELKSRATYFTALAQSLNRTGRGDVAIAASLRALVLESHVPERYRELGDTLRHQGRLTEAALVYREALRLRPDDAGAHGALGDVLLERGKMQEAVDEYEAQLALDPLDIVGYHRLGRGHLCRGEWSRALRSFRQGVHLKRDDVPCLVGMSEALMYLGSFEEATDALRNALAIAPTNVNACQQFVRALQLLGRIRDAVGAQITLGDALRAEEQYRDAARAYGEALKLKPDCLPALLGLAHMHIALREYREALCPLHSALAMDPQNSRARVDLATAYHLAGDTKEGWNEFRWHYNLHGTVRQGFEQPVWDGSPLGGRTILLWTSQGRGDTIQFLRYIQFVKGQGARVVVQCHHAGLIELIERIPGVERVVTAKAPLPAFDVHAPLVYLPAFIPICQPMRSDDVPYLSVDGHSTAAWRQRISPDGRTLVGLSWGGNVETAPSRFVSLRAFAPLAEVPGVRFISLQHGLQSAELLAPPQELRIERMVNESTSIADAAALIHKLDLVITVDTMIAHLAGALAKPVWTLLRYATNWRWQAEGERTPWYPTMRLFRQARPDDWGGVVERVRLALHEWQSGNTNDASRIVTPPSQTAALEGTLQGPRPIDAN